MTVYFQKHRSRQSLNNNRTIQRSRFGGKFTGEAATGSDVGFTSTDLWAGMQQ